MKTLRDACTPRSSVFDRARQDVALDLTDLVDNRIDSKDFFAENYLTEGMKRLLHAAFARFDGTGSTGIIKLTQAMGGGKTHNMIALGLLAKNPKLRKQVMGESFFPKLGAVRVVAFTGRQSDAAFGVWGALAEQLGKKELFKDYYSPLSAPGQTAWVNLLKGEPLLILLDELPPYLENARAKTVGNTDLSVVTTTALSNLLVAVGKNELSNVCVVISDLKATYEGGTEQINRALLNLENEVGRVALPLEPVALNTDEVYHILRTRLFSKLPNDKDIKDIADGYGQSVHDAKQMGLTSLSAEKLAQQIRESYPFHPSIRDLYARFRENPGFQQTRGLIRLMRVMVSRLYGEGGAADRIHLIRPYDLDLNDRDTLTEVTSINPTLDNAISHDIASNGQSVSEVLDSERGNSDTQDILKLLLVASLANVPNGLLGLTLSEVFGYLSAPGRNISKSKETLGDLSTGAWYLHTTKDGRLFLKNVQNLVAKLKTTADSYQRQHALRELRDVLAVLFQPSLKDCYQEVQVLPALDEIKVQADKVLLILYEPHPGGLHPDLLKFYNDLDYKNRVLFLSGQRDTLNALLEVAKEHKAISSIIEEMGKEGVADSDPQRREASDLLDKTRLRLLSAARETFNTLIYPHDGSLLTADFYMSFTNNEYSGEKQVRDALKAKQKFTEEVNGETFRKKCEQRLFTQKVMPWSEVKKRAAINTLWQWHQPDALDHLKEELVHKTEQWREQGSYIEKGPFPPPQTDVQIQLLSRDEETGEVTLRLTPVHGDTVHYEIGADATAASLVAEKPKAFKTSALRVSFLCGDEKGQHEQGPARLWTNQITIRSRTYQSGSERMVELRAAPEANIRYTTDGTDPKVSGGSYNEPFVVPKGTLVVLAVADKDGIVSEIHRLEIDWSADDDVKVEPAKAATWVRSHSLKTSKESYEFINQLKKHRALVVGPRVTIVGQKWLEINTDPGLSVSGEQVERLVEQLREVLAEGQVTIETDGLFFPSGQDLLDWVSDSKTELKPGEVSQQ